MPTVPVTWLEEQTANTTTANGQFDPEIVQLANGNILVLWTSNDDTGAGASAGTDVIGQIFSPEGVKIGGEISLNNFGFLQNERNGSIAALPNGGFVVAYERSNISTGNVELCIDTYNAAGTYVHGSFIESDAAGDPTYGSPVVAASSGTSVMVAYTVTNAGSTSVVSRIYDPSANTVAAQVPMLTGAFDPDVTVLNNGNYIVTGSYGGADSYIAYRIMSPTNTNVLGNTAVPTSNTNTFADSDSSVTALAGGGFAISYTSTNAGDSDIRVHAFDAAGAQTGSSYVGTAGISAVTNFNESSIAGLADGTIVVTHDDDGDGVLEISRFSATAVYQGTFTNAALTPTSVSSTALADGRFAAVWHNGDGSGEISLEIFDTRDVVNGTPVNSTNLQVGTVGADTFTVNAATGTAYGGAGDDVITSDGSTNIFGGEGNDIIFAGLGTSELLDGGNGTDTLNTTLFNGYYEVNLTTGVTNFAPESYVNFENIVMGNGGSTIIGTTGANVITGGTGNDTIYGATIGSFSNGASDTINSGDGNDIVHSGGAGTFLLGNGDDTFVAGNTSLENADGGDGIDTVNGTNFNGNYNINLAAGTTNFGETFTNFENATTGNGNDILSGTNGDNILNGTGGNDILAGLGGDDTLIGGAGSNQYIGSTGNDTYIVQAANPTEAVLQTLFEAAGEGTDTVQVTTSVFALEWYGSSELENLTLTDNAAHTAIGNAFNNIITGGTGADDLFGRDGNDRLIGGSGAANTMIGGAGNDTYVVTAVGDTVIEFVGEGTDTVEASVASFTLRDNVDNLTFTGANTDRIGVGNAGFNVIRGLGGADSLNGLGGADDIIGGSGNDILQGGTDGSQDWFVYLGGETGLDRILDFQSGVDKIAFSLAGFSPTATRDFVSGVGAVATSANSTILYDPSTGIVSYDDDGNGAGAAIQIAQLNAGQPFVATDFLFTGSY